MDHLSVPQVLGLLAIVLGTAKLFGASFQYFGQPAVLGELIAGVVLGTSAIGLVNPKGETLQLLAELGVVILLLEIGLETDLAKLLKVGGAALTVASVGVVLPFAFGFAVCSALGLSNLTSLVAGATLTATSVGITARVLLDLNRLQEPESQIILGAAVLDDVMGLVILAVVTTLTRGEEVTAVGIAETAGLACGFLVGTLLIGRFAIPVLVRHACRIDLPGTPTILALSLAFALAWLAAESGSALIIGAFATGLLLRETPHAQEMAQGVTRLGHFFVPIFFVSVGAAVDVRALNPFDPTNDQTFLIGGLLLVAAVAGKFLAGYSPFWFRGQKRVVGVGMIPRGEVGLIFAQMGLATGAFTSGVFGAIMFVIMATTFLTPPLLKRVFPPLEPNRIPSEPAGIADLVTKS